MDNELIGKIRNHSSYDENVHGALIEVIEKEYSSEQLHVTQDDPIVTDSLIRGMLSSMLASQAEDSDDATAHKNRLQQARELLRKAFNFLNRRAQDTNDEPIQLDGLQLDEPLHRKAA